MNIGGMRHRVTFQTASETDNDFGEPEDTWSNILTGAVWARVEPLAGNERYSAMQEKAKVDYKITCRYQDGLNALAPNDRATWKSKIFDIQSVIITDDIKKHMQVFVREHI